MRGKKNIPNLGRIVPNLGTIFRLLRPLVLGLRSGRVGDVLSALTGGKAVRSEMTESTPTRAEYVLEWR